MSQSRLFIETNEAEARSLQSSFEFAFEDDGFAISAFEDLENPGDWTVSVYTSTDQVEELSTRMTALAGDLGFEIELQREDLPETDWVAETLRELHCVRAGRFVMHGSHEMDAPAPHEIGLQIDAGLAFGTGHHGTTAGCLDMLSEVSKRKTFYNALDLGTGSGVLAIAVAKAHQAQVLATDIDPVATETARQNAKINGTQDCVECITASGFTHRRFGEQAPFDLVIANILAKPLQSMALEIALHTMPGGTIILSGLLPHQQRMIVATFRQHNIMFEKSYIRDGWLVLVLSKP
ncbi:MAG: 50S ribosomal protein L11 methyltransferase [Rhizobiaceae bacterium]|nr:50S ribosomal protein L11 methyltransferase [Rhizobiaceae bacterium]